VTFVSLGGPRARGALGTKRARGLAHSEVLALGSLRRMAGVVLAPVVPTYRRHFNLGQFPFTARGSVLSLDQVPRLRAALSPIGRGRDSGYPLPPAQTRAGAANAHGSYLGSIKTWRQNADAHAPARLARPPSSESGTG
jgi:hypothetical protein